MSEVLYKKIRELVAILKTEDIDEIELRNWWTTVRVARRRTLAGAAAEETPVGGVPAEGSAGGASAAEPAASGVSRVQEEHSALLQEPTAAEAAHAGEDGTLDKIVSPMVGTFYRASAPGSEPFVDVGDRVEVGEILCIIEAMKLMNEIEADRSGIIKRVLVQDSQPVEYGQPLFLVESA